MDCKQAVYFMHDLLDDDLDREYVKELKAHMLECQDCCEHFDQLEEADRLLYRVNRRFQPVLGNSADRIMSMILKSRQKADRIYPAPPPA